MKRASSWLCGTSTPARVCTSDVARRTSRIHCWCTPRTRWRYVASVRCTSCERMSFIACAISDRGCHCAGVQCCESRDRLAAHQSWRICRWHCADDSHRGCRVTLASSGHRNPFGGFDSLDAAPCASRTQGRVEPAELHAARHTMKRFARCRQQTRGPNCRGPDLVPGECG